MASSDPSGVAPTTAMHTIAHPKGNVLLFAPPAALLQSVSPDALPAGCLLFEGSQKVEQLSGAGDTVAFAYRPSSAGFVPTAESSPFAASVLQCLLHQWRSIATRYACAQRSFSASIAAVFPFAPLQAAVAHLSSAEAAPAWHAQMLADFLLSTTRAVVPALVPDEELAYKANVVLAGFLASTAAAAPPSTAAPTAAAAAAAGSTAAEGSVTQRLPQPRTLQVLEMYTKELFAQNIAWELNFTAKNALQPQFTEHTLAVLTEGDTYTCVVIHKLADEPNAVFVPGAGDQAAGVFERVLAQAADADTLRELGVCCLLDTEDEAAADTRITQLDVVVVDCSGSMSSLAFPQADREMKRSDAAQILFNMIVDKYRGMELHARVACVLFGSNIETACQFTDDLVMFETLLGRARGMGGTALWDAIAHAATMLQTERARLIADGSARPNCIARVIAVTDGQDGDSRQRNDAVARSCRANNVVVDAFMLGDDNDTLLRTLSHATGGHTLAFRDLQDATDLFEQPFVVNAAARPSREDLDPVDNLAVFSDLTKYPRITSSTARALVAAPRPAPSATSGGSSGGSSGVGGGSSGSSSGGGSSGGSSSSAGALRRLQTELVAFARDARGRAGVLAMDVSDLLNWRLLVSAPAASHYAGCFLVVNVTIPSGYPFQAPRFEFASSDVFHPQISSSGRACNETSATWAPSRCILDGVADLMETLAKPDVGSAVNSWAASLLQTDPAGYQAEVDKRKPNLTLEKARELSDDWTDLADPTPAPVPAPTT